jgi:serine/threonine-protein kinase
LGNTKPQASPIKSDSAQDSEVNSGGLQMNDVFKTYANPGFGITVSYPPTWSVDELRNDPDTPSDNSIVAIFKSPTQGPDDKYIENVILKVQGPRSDIKSLETYTQDSIQAFESMSDISITKSGEGTLAGIPAHQVEYTSTAIEGLDLKKMQVFTVIDNIAYVVTFGAEQSEYDKNIQDAENLINSVRILSASVLQHEK